ncbi:unnamed protein product [Caenorhabditis bovis]|uniref:Uncharacterized protein n=1 Tax=Caenorhabditis bovis TaxID=2654633 RepID=A0A8S1EYP9_9PELO|nr:unnamed protein product [Caenorhabditis bovis]
MASTSDRNTDYLRFLQQFYINLIETHQIQMNISERQFLADRGNMRAYREWTGNKMKICDLYTSWLVELNKCATSTFDDVARTMHAMMTADCYWFLAKLNKPPFSPRCSNYSKACENLEHVFTILNESLNISNPFYQHVLAKYEKLVNDYRMAIGEGTLSGTSKHVPLNMTAWDISKCKEASRTLKNLKERSRGRHESKKSGISTQILQLSRLMLSTLV